MENKYTKLVVLLWMMVFSLPSWAQYQMEYLNRGVVAVRSGSNNFISWRFMGTEEDNVTFNLYRGGTKVNGTPLTVTNYSDNGAAANAQYYVRAIINNVEQGPSETVSVWAQNYLSVPMQIPAGGTTPSGEAYTYSSSDCSIGDVDGDGVYELFVKWEPSNAKDNSQSGYTGNVYIDCYRLTGTRLWRIDLGRNIRAGAHYTQFQVYDFNSDGKAEMMVKTSDATIDGTGKVIGSAGADHRNSGGYVLAGPEFLTVFNGLTGANMATVNYLPARGTVSAWGDGYGNRVDRFRAGVAYLDGKKPSAIFCRGYYTRLTMAAWDWNGSTLTSRWVFDSGNSSSNAYYGQGNHSLSVADVDNDGKQEIISGAAVIDDNGTGLYSTGFGHGDAGHVSDFDPTIPGIEVFNIQESDDDDDCYFYSPSQKRVIWKKGTTGGEGPGRGVMANITEQFAGAEGWVAGGQTTGGPWQVNGNSMGTAGPPSCNFLLWWDGDLARELSNGTTVDKYPSGRLLTATDCSSNNGSKSTPSLSGDIIGDWREELIVRTSNNTAIRIYTTTTTSNFKVRTLLHDAQYRVALAWQNTAYNQPPHPSFYLGTGVNLPAKPNIVIVGDNKLPTVSITAPANNTSYLAPATITIDANASDADGTISKVDFYNGSTLIGSDNSSTYSFDWSNVAAGVYTITAVATDNKNGSTTSTPITITVTASPACTATATASGNTTICQGGSVVLTASAGTAYVWRNGNNQVGTGATYTATNSGAYTVEVTCSNGAKGTSTPITVTLTSPATWYADTDADGVGDAAITQSACAQPTGYVATSGDQCPSDGNKTTPGDCGCGKQEGSCADCAGIVNGTAVEDICKRCVGGTTGKTACSSVSEAEDDTCALIGVVEDNNEGYSGLGYVNVNNTLTSYVEFAVFASSTGNATLSFRYANGTTADRPAQILVNDVALPNNLSFPTTGSWIDWEILETQIPFIIGNNKLRIISTTANGLANIDQIGYVSSSVKKGTCGLVTLTQDDLQLHGISLFPNPSKDQFELQLDNTSDLKVYSSQGTLIQTFNSVNHLKFGSAYATGLYNIQVSSLGNTYVFKIVKE